MNFIKLSNTWSRLFIETKKMDDNERILKLVFAQRMKNRLYSFFCEKWIIYLDDKMLI